MGNKRTLEILGDGQILHQSRSKHIYNWLTATFFLWLKQTTNMCSQVVYVEGLEHSAEPIHKLGCLRKCMNLLIHRI